MLAVGTLAVIFGFPGGQAVVTQERGKEHVVIRRVDYIVESDSYCDSSSGRYRQVVRLGDALVAAAKRRDAGAIAALVRYPLRVNVGEGSGVTRRIRTEYVANRAELLSRFHAVFTPHVLELLRVAEPHDVFCRNGMSSIGNGLVWAQTVSGDEVRVAVLNR